MMLRSLAVIAAILASTTVSAKTDHVYGPPPAWDDYVRLATVAIQAALPDPGRWSIEFPNGYAATGWSHHGKARGYLTCARVSAIGVPQAGRRSFPAAIVIDYGKVLLVDVQPASPHSIIDLVCSTIAERGILSPASVMITAEPRTSTIAHWGLTIAPMAEGAYVSAVTPGGPAARAGLTPGQVITRINGIESAPLGPAMSKLFESEVAALSLDTVTGQQLVLRNLP